MRTTRPENRKFQAAFAGLVIGFTAAAPVLAQDTPEEPDRASSQLWLTFRALRPLENKQWVMHFDARTNGEEGATRSASLDGRTRVNFYATSWLDVYPEILLRYTHQGEDFNTYKVWLRGGVRFRLPHAQLLVNRERAPLQRLDLGVLLRLEWQNTFFAGDHDSSWRARGRVEARFPLNRENMIVDKTVYLRGDAEAFVPLGNETPARFSNRWRFRAGVGYRFSFSWRIEALGIWQMSRNTLQEDFGTAEYILILRLNHYFH
jgi:hypothetical protein